MAVSSTDQESVTHIGGATLLGPFVLVMRLAPVGWCSTETAASVSYDHGPVLVGREDSYCAAHGEGYESVGEDEVDVCVAHAALGCGWGEGMAGVGVASAGGVAEDRVYVCDDRDVGSVA